MSEDDIERKVSVIFATDVVSYSVAMEAAEAKTVKNLRSCWKILDSLFSKHGGRIFNTGGDSVLAEFKSAVAAVECAVEYQDAILVRNEKLTKDDQLIFRIGINMGDVIEEGGNLLGEGVNIAARLEAFAQPGGVCISQPIYDLVKKRTNFSFVDLGQQKVKNTVLQAIDLEIPSAQPRSAKISSPASRKKRIFFSSLAITSLIIVGGFASLFFEEQQSFKDTDSLVTIDRFIALMRMERYEEAKQVAENLAQQKTIRKTAKAEAINLIALTYYAQNQSSQASEVFNQQKDLDSRVSIRSLRALWKSNSNSKEIEDMLEDLKKLGLN